ncbi:MAG: hypothetical protein JW829_20865 [Pirellulales bacterium]|nr:hypothetical protein [Pirellulales bacterium]
MSPKLKKLTAWSLIAVLAIIAGFGEALHSFPGCGHGVQIGDSIVLLGIRLPDQLGFIDEGSRLEQPNGREIPVYDEAECPICSVVCKTYTAAHVAHLVLVMPLVHDLPADFFRNVPDAALHLFEARAPPLG